MTRMQGVAGWMVALAAAGFAPQGAAVPLVTSVTLDTVTHLDVDWTFLAADSGLAGSWTGLHWEAALTPTFAGGVWSVDAHYRHLDGPHGEGAEPILHFIGTVSFAPGTGAALSMPVQDHFAPDLHVSAHIGGLAANGPAAPPAVPPGFARVIVSHVPEPAASMLMLLGLGLLGYRVRTRGVPPVTLR